MGRAPRRLAFFLFALSFVGFLDEFSSGVPVVSAPQIRSVFGLDFAALSLVLLALPGLSALLVETPLVLLSERWGRRRVVASCLWTMAACSLLAALSSEAWLLALSFVLWSPANGVGTGLCEAQLMDAAPHRRERMMTRWTLMGAFGDMAAPAVLALLSFAGLGFRAGMLVVAAMLATHGWLLVRVSWPGEPDPDRAEMPEPRPQLWDRLRSALAVPGLSGWVVAVLSCGLLDEVLVAFGALYLHEAFDASLLQQGSAFAGFSLGCALGLSVSERLFSVMSARRLLFLSCVACALSFVLWLQSSSLHASIACLALLGVFTAPLFPIATALAYRTAPGRSTTVVALIQLTAPFELFLPLLVGWLADEAGLFRALILLGLQPICILLVLWRTRTRKHARRYFR